MIRLTNSLKRRLVNQLKGFPHNFNQDKKFIIDFAFQSLGPASPNSFIDLGGIWGVDGAYTFYTLDEYSIARAFLVDTHITEVVQERGKKYSNLELITGNFGEQQVISQLAKVGVIFLFDVLLHQVDPDWDEILEIYAPLTKYFAVHNQQFIASETTLRLLDLGQKQYFENVPHNKNHPSYRSLFEKLDEFDPNHDRLRKDIPAIWQWGITNRDLRTKMQNLGFTEKYHKNCGQLGRLKNFQNHAFVFQKAKEA